MRVQKSTAMTVVTHDGTDGQMTRGRGALSFRLGDFFRSGTVLGFGEPRLQCFKVAPRGRGIRTILIVFQSNKHLAGLHLISDIHTDRRDLTDDLRCEFDLVSGNDVTGGIENDTPFGAWNCRSGMNANNIDFRRRIETAVDEP